MFPSTHTPQITFFSSSLIIYCFIKKKKIETHALTYIFPAVSHSLPHLVCALLLGVMALLFELSDLVDFLSVVTLLAYTLMAFSVLVLR